MTGTPRHIGPWTLIRTREPYSNPWIRVEHNEVLCPSGNPGIYGVVRFRHRALGAVPLHDDQSVTLVGQHRFPFDAWSWEIPEGGGDPDCDPLDEMRRELREETGLSASVWEPLGELQLSNSVCDERAQIWLASGLRVEGSPKPDPSEQLQLRRLPFVDALGMVLDGRIADAITVVALLRTARILGL